MRTEYIFFIYAAGVIINLLVMAHVWDRLRKERRLGRVRLAAIMFFILLSFGTWVYVAAYGLWSLIRKGGGR